MTSYSLKDAATLAEASYSAGRIKKPKVLKSLDLQDVQAHLLDGNILLLPGSNSVRDYLRFNLRPLRLGHRQFTMNSNDTEKGASGTIWHQGFLVYARAIFDWLQAEGVRPNYIIGHSLGAAATQILSKTYNVPAIGFAAPRPKWVKSRVKNDGKCLLLNRSDDLVPKLPGDFSHMGQAKLLTSLTDRRFLAHSMPRYIQIVAEAVQSQVLPDKWSG